jgi:DNA polymerase-3 subunit delta'
MGVKAGEDGLPESDRFAPAPHPRNTFQLFGHEQAESEFLEAFRAGRMPQAWIIGGPPGIGKGTLAWRMARFVAAHPDSTSPAVQQAKNLAVDPGHPAARKISALAYGDLALLRREWVEKNKKFATRITVDDVRRALHKFEQAAGEGGWRMALIDSADDLNVSSANALLKLIEEPPPRSLFLLVAHQPGRLLPTIRSRCRMLMLQPLETPALSAAVRAALDAADLPAPGDALGRACARASRQAAAGQLARRPSHRGRHLGTRGRSGIRSLFALVFRLARRRPATKSGAWPTRAGALCGCLGISGARNTRSGNL